MIYINKAYLHLFKKMNHEYIYTLSKGIYLAFDDEEHKKLQQENERLKDKLSNVAYIGLKYALRIDKANEYIEHENFKRNVLVGVSTKKYTKNILNNVSNILNGGDDK